MFPCGIKNASLVEESTDIDGFNDDAIALVRFHVIEPWSLNRFGDVALSTQ